MLAKLLGAVVGATRGQGEHQPAAVPPEALSFAPMVPLTPPPAQNDDGMQRLCDGVEKALKEAGHLPYDASPEA